MKKFILLYLILKVAMNRPISDFDLDLATVINEAEPERYAIAAVLHTMSRFVAAGHDLPEMYSGLDWTYDLLEVYRGSRS